MKKNTLRLVYFLVLFTVISILVFELAFRFYTPESFITLLSHLSILGLTPSFDTLFVFLLFISLLISVILYFSLSAIIKKKVKT